MSAIHERLRAARPHTWRRLGAIAALTSAAIALAPAPNAAAVPARGNSPWSVLLCKFHDVSAQPQPAGFFNRFFGPAGSGTGNLYDYYRGQSYGRLLIAPSVHGWYTMPYNKSTEAGKSRWQKIQDCVATASAAGYAVPAGNHVAVMTNSQQDSGSAGGEVLLDPLAWDTRFAAHEMGHGYGLDHSFSNDTTAFHGGGPGEYDDPWDEMSAQAVFTANNPTWGPAAIGFNAFARDKLGFLPMNRIITFGGNGASAGTYNLAPLQVPSAVGPLLVRVPFDPGDLFHYYTVEFDRKLGSSQAIPNDIVLIHEVRNGQPTLLRQLSVAGKPPVQHLSANRVTINVGAISGDHATVSITSAIADRCLQGYVWRQARPSDHVCVTGSTRSQAWADNAVASSRWVNGAYGPHTCVQGYVWREAFAGDDVCVTGSNRSLAAYDNSQAAARRNPARFVYGPNTCARGYVWRQADNNDYVCVAGSTRSQAAYDNSVASSRWVSGAYGPHTCVQGYVWREAFPGDDVCVTGSNRSLAAYDNTQVAARVARASG